MKRVIAIHDLSAVGKCSLTVALPIISSFKIECNIIPTAILSTHLAFPHPYIYDLEHINLKILEHYKSLNFKVDAFYLGYLGNDKLIDDSLKYLEYFNESKLFLDPVFGDLGKLYPTFDLSYPKKMLNLVKKSYCIIPNLTEASYLLNIPYHEFNLEETKEIAIKLSALGPKIVIITGIKKDNQIGALGFNKDTNEFFETYNDYIDGYFHGTGDIFSSVIVGSLLRNDSILKALELATKFTYLSINSTYINKQDYRYGVNFEEFLYLLKD